MDKNKLLKAISLFTVFFKIGLFTFGGGYAMIPIIEREIADKKHWIKNEEILDIFAISESTPGPIAINSATFVGFRVAGVLGAACATLGVVIPSFTIIFIISFVLDKFKSLKSVEYAFFGIKSGVIALIIRALYTMAKKCPKNIISAVIAAAVFAVAVFFDVNLFLIIVCAAAVGLVYRLISLKVNAKRGNAK